MSKFASGPQLANVEQMSLSDLDQAEAKISAQDSADPSGSGADSPAMNKAVGAMSGFTALEAIVEVLTDLTQSPASQPAAQHASSTTRDFLTGKHKKAAPSAFIPQPQAQALVRKAEPIVRASVRAVPLMQDNRKPARSNFLNGGGKKGHGKGIDLFERANIAQSSMQSATKGMKASPEIASRLLSDERKLQLGMIRRAKDNLSFAAIQSAPTDARARNAFDHLGQEQQSKMMRMSAAPKMAAPSAPAPSIARA